MDTSVEAVTTDTLGVFQMGSFTTKKAAVNAALAEFVKLLKRRELLGMRGKVRWKEIFARCGPTGGAGGRDTRRRLGMDRSLQRLRFGPNGVSAAIHRRRESAGNSGSGPDGDSPQST
jgi:hypothetical protein